MYDRPNATELLDAARIHLEQHVIPAVRGDGKLYFQTLVAINVLKIVGRELALGSNHAVAEWAGLNALDGVTVPLPDGDLATRQTAIAARNQALCAAIRAGDYDDPTRAALLAAHVRQTTIAQLEVANPRLLHTLAQEDAARSPADHP